MTDPVVPAPADRVPAAPLGRADLLAALLDGLPETVFFKDASSRYLLVSRLMAERLGFDDPQELIGKTDFDFFDPEHAAHSYHDEQIILATGHPIINREEKETWKDGHVTWVSTTKLPLRDSTGRIVGTFGISRDISARKLTDEERRELEIRLQLVQKLESIGRLAAGVAHEVNTPTQFVSDNTRFLSQAFDQLREILQRYQALRLVAQRHEDCAELIASTVDLEQQAELDWLLAEIPRTFEQTLEGLARVSRIVRSLNEFSHPHAPEKVLTDLHRTIDTAISISRHEWKYSADVTTEFDPTLPPVPCIVDTFGQAILNLIINAAHAIEEARAARPAQDKGKIVVRTRRTEGWALIEVADDGLGIPEKIRSRIFEPFFTTKPAGLGTGQGLTVVQAVIVKQHGGKIEFDSEIDRGTTFRLYLPLAGTTVPTLA